MICSWFERFACFLRAYYSNVYNRFSQFSPFSCQKSELLPSLFTQLLFFKDRRDQFTLVALSHERIALLFFLSQKTSDSLEKPTIKFPTLEFRSVTFFEIWVYKDHKMTYNFLRKDLKWFFTFRNGSRWNKNVRNFLTGPRDKIGATTLTQQPDHVFLANNWLIV